MSDKEDITEQDIEHYLEGKDEVSSLYAQSKSLKAPDHLEFSIKRMAREAQQQSGSHPVGNKNAWFVPLSIAATIVITVTLVLFLDTQKEDESKRIATIENNTSKEILPIEQTAPQQQTASVRKSGSMDPDRQQVSPPKPTIDKKPMKSQSEAVAVATMTEPSQPETNKPEPVKPQSINREEQQQVATKDENFELPAHLRDMIQPTSAGSDKELLPPEVLKTWTRQQWRQQILDLQKAGHSELADKYIEHYPKYFPDDTLKLNN